MKYTHYIYLYNNIYSISIRNLLGRNMLLATSHIYIHKHTHTHIHTHTHTSHTHHTHYRSIHNLLGRNLVLWTLQKKRPTTWVKETCWEEICDYEHGGKIFIHDGRKYLGCIYIYTYTYMYIYIHIYILTRRTQISVTL